MCFHLCFCKEATAFSKHMITNSLLVIVRYCPMIYNMMKIYQLKWGNQMPSDLQSFH